MGSSDLGFFRLARPRNPPLGASIAPCPRFGKSRLESDLSRFLPHGWEAFASQQHLQQPLANGLQHLAPPLTANAPRPALQLPRDLDPLRVPEHVAIIMDGNSRWAKLRGLPAQRGHEAGVNVLRTIVDLSVRWGIKVLTVFAFSTENWRRPTIETQVLMELFERVISEDSMTLFTKNVCVHFIGDLSKLPHTLRSVVSQVQNRTRNNKGLKLVVALSYSGRHDIVQACKALATDIQRGAVQIDEIDESLVQSKLLTAWDNEIGDPDLLIRTSGEERLSNFMLWQLAYTELVFVPELWPDFGEEEYKRALLTYQQRERRFGRHQ